jgi:hypothetical protein
MPKSELKFCGWCGVLVHHLDEAQERCGNCAAPATDRIIGQFSKEDAEKMMFPREYEETEDVR